MLGFIISTLAFFAAMYAMNRYFDNQGIDKASSRNLLVMVIATLISYGAGWVVDKVDGDADKPQKSMVEVMQSGDPVLMTKMLIGIN